MRMLGAAAMVAGLAASPAWAAEQAPAAVALAVAPVAVAASAALPESVGETAAVLPPVLLAGNAAAPAPALPMMRHGFGYSSTAFYPLKDSTFHFTVGTRVATRALAGRTTDAPWAPLLWTPRGSGLRSMRRMSPVAFVGVDRPVADGMTLGLDAGVAVGHINYFNHGPRAMAADHFSHGGNGTNPLARMTLAYRF